MAVFWDVALYSLVDTDISEEFTFSPDDGGGKLLRNVGQYLPDYTVLHPRRWLSSGTYLYAYWRYLLY
jgi:hypothetical protein